MEPANRVVEGKELALISLRYRLTVSFRVNKKEGNDLDERNLAVGQTR
jgi:hypothetical protein